MLHIILTYRPVGLYILEMELEKTSQAESTRINIIDCAANEILHVGFQSASIGSILQKAGVSKGCFYHHFPAKQDLGYAVLDELILKARSEMWEPLLKSENPLESIIHFYRQPANLLDSEIIKYGCPINNLAQEMSPIDEGFRSRIENSITEWNQQLANELQRFQKNGLMKRDVSASEIATLIIATTQGATGIAKNTQNPNSFIEYTHGLANYLCTLQL